jgi:hypothetical protein
MTTGIDPYRMGALPIRAIRGGAGEPPSQAWALSLRGTRDSPADARVAAASFSERQLPIATAVRRRPSLTT